MMAMTATSRVPQTYFRKIAALPGEHGAWVFILSPLLIGLVVGDDFNAGSLALVVGATAAFLIRQPVTLAIKAYSGRRSKSDLPAARFWMVLYGLVGLLALGELVVLRYGYVLWLALPGVPVFAWHLWLVSRRAERRQVNIELVGSGVLALAAPAAYWVGVGSPEPVGWWLFGLTWFQSAASIVYAYLRLEQRELREAPTPTVRLRMGQRALLYTGFNLLATLALGLLHVLPGWIFLPYLLQAAETFYGTLMPAVGYKPTRIGIRQLIVSTLFTILFIVTWPI